MSKHGQEYNEHRTYKEGFDDGRKYTNLMNEIEMHKPRTDWHSTLVAVVIIVAVGFLIYAVVTEAGNYNFYAETLDQCLKATNQFSGVLYQNICDGSTYFVASGFWDYAVPFIGLAIGLGMILATFRMILD